MKKALRSTGGSKTSSADRLSRILERRLATRMRPLLARVAQFRRCRRGRSLLLVGPGSAVAACRDAAPACRICRGGGRFESSPGQGMEIEVTVPH